MKTAGIAAIKKELEELDKNELLQLCLRLGKFKKDNKALLTYLLFEAYNEDDYITSVKQTLNNSFTTLNTNSYFYMKKTIRKVLRELKTFAKYSGKKTTEIELLLYFCDALNSISPNIHHNTTLHNLYNRQITTITKHINALHSDLQYDYNLQLQALLNT